MARQRCFYFDNLDLLNEAYKLEPGDIVYFSGTVYTARDAAHIRLSAALKDGRPLPFPLENSIIYYAGPTEAPPGKPIGSCGPTTSSRMDKFTPELMDAGLFATVGKGDRNDEVYASIVKNKGLYLCAVGGAGALMSKSITECEVIAYQDLGCESVKKLETVNMPLIVGINSSGDSIFRKTQS